MKYLLIAPCVVAASAQRRGRQEEVAAYGDAALDSYAADDAGEDPLAALASNIPGVPGEDYPIYAEVPETAFACDGQVDGGYYADPEAECQAFHICTADGAGGLAKYSFLCPNGTLFNQNYFICDWWFNFDCATAEELYSLNDEIAAERAALAGASDQAEYGAAAENSYSAPVPPPVTEAAYDYSYDDYVEAPAATYGADYGLDTYEEETTVAAVEEYLSPEARRGRNRGGSRGGRRQSGRRPSGRRNFRG